MHRDEFSEVKMDILSSTVNVGFNWTKIGQADARPIGGLACAWAMARQRLKEYRRQVDAATRCSGVCPPYLT